MAPSKLNSNRRLEREIQAILDDSKQNDDPDVTALLLDGDLRHWSGRIKGPLGTPYEGGYFFLDIVIPEAYPYEPPKIQFDTKVWHPNVSSQTGAICLDILKTEWSPALTIRTALLSIEALLAAPEPDDPQDYQVATMYKTNNQEFQRQAGEWRRIYASQKEWPYEAKIKTLTDIGIPEQQARKALQHTKWDVNAAAMEWLQND